MHSKAMERLSSITEKMLFLKQNAIQNLFKQFKFTTKVIKICSYFLISISAMAILSSCFLKKGNTNTVNKTVIVYPAPPDTARFQYLTKFSTSEDIEPKQSAFSEMIVGPEKVKVMVKPYGVAVRKGKIYVCDGYGGGMEIIDLEKKKFNFFSPKGRGQLKNPINCFVDDKGFIYVADSYRTEIVIFDENGNFVRSFGENENFKPTDVCVYDNKIFVANITDSKISVYSTDSTNKLLYTFPEKVVEEDSASHLCAPSNIAIYNNKIYISDFGCGMIRVFSIDGKYIKNIGSQGTSIGQFSKVKGVAVDKEYNIFAVDAAFNNIQVFNEKGQLLMFFGGKTNLPGGLNLPAKITIDYDNLKYFQKYVAPDFDLKYLVFVTSQYGPDKINVYGRVEPKVKSGK